MSPIRKHLFLGLADKFPSPARERLRLAVLTDEPIEFCEEFHFAIRSGDVRERHLVATLGTEQFAVDLGAEVREAVCV